jgi:peptidyl-prolyl cis-trans isomerase D
MLAYNREQRDFTWAEMTATALNRPVPEPTKDQIMAQYKATPATYTAPLTRDITYAWLSPEMLQDQVAVDEAELKDSYNLQSDRFNKPEKRSLERMVFATEKEATDARNLLDAGSATFNTLLADQKLTPKDVDLGEVTRGSLSKDAADVVFAAKDTGIVGPVQSSLGPALFRINAIIAADITPYDVARPMLVAELSGDAERRLINTMVTDIDDMLAAGATLEELAKESNMTLGNISLTADTTDGIAAYENFRKAANSAKTSDFPEIKDLADGGIFALRVNKIIDPALKPLSEVKLQVIADWKRAETVRLLRVKAEKLKGDLDQGASFGSLETKAETGVQRSHVIAAIPPALLTDMFKKDIKPGQASVAAGTDSVFIARLDKINAFDPTLADNKSLIEAIQGQIDAQTGNDLLNVYADALRSRDGITINQAAINQINAQLTSR